MNKIPRIAVIGAGISGLSCSKNLHDNAFYVFVVDKSRGPAGRMSTRRGDGWQCDHGAQYFTARDPGFRAEVARWQAAGVAGVWPMRLAVFNEVGGQRSETRLERFVGVPRMTAPARLLADTLPLTAQTTITRLERMPAGWQMTSAEHGQLPGHFDAVLLAVPAPQAVPLLDAVAPDLAAIAAGAVMRGSWALMLRYDAPVALSFDAAFVNSGPLRWVARDNSKPGRGTAAGLRPARRPRPAGLVGPPLALRRYRFGPRRRLRLGCRAAHRPVRRLAQWRQGRRRMAERTGAGPAGRAVFRRGMTRRGVRHGLQRRLVQARSAPS